VNISAGADSRSVWIFTELMNTKIVTEDRVLSPEYQLSNRYAAKHTKPIINTYAEVAAKTIVI
jgi:hypothetical protein